MTLRSDLQARLVDGSRRLNADRQGVLREQGTTSALVVLVLPLLECLLQHDDPGEVSDILGELVGKDQRRNILEALRNPPGIKNLVEYDKVLQDACRALVAALGGETSADSGARTHVQIRTGDRSRVEQTRVYAPSGDLTVHEAHDTQAAMRRQALLGMLRRLQTECSVLQLGRVDAGESRHQQPMRLERVYIGLGTERQVPMTQEEIEASPERGESRRGEQNNRALLAIEALGSPGVTGRKRQPDGSLHPVTFRRGPARLMLLGAPGSGKSTFVNHLTLALAGASLCMLDGDEPEPHGGWLSLLPGWELGSLLPVRIILRDLADLPELLKAERGTLQFLHDYLARTLGAHANALDEIVNALTEGTALLLFDGLDEVVGEPVLNRVVETIQDAVATYTRCPVLVTCRVLDYQSNPKRQLSGFQTETLASLTDRQAQTFVRAWYDELAATGRQTLGTAERLQQALTHRPDLRDLARLPLLLTMIAIVHSGKGSLPDARALLYAECIDLLLLRWRQEPDAPDVLERLNLPKFRQNDLLALMARIGYVAHSEAERDEDTTRPAALRLARLREILEETFAPYAGGDDRRRDELASILLHEIATRNGLLLKQSGEGGEAYTFPHRTFQEFLAGYYLKGHKRYYQECAALAAKPHWHEALSLMVGHQVLSDDEFERPLELVGKLLDSEPTAQTLAGELLNLIGRERVQTRYDAAAVRADGLWGRARFVLLRLATHGEAPDAPATLRVRAGLTHGLLCYGDVGTLASGAMPPLPDPRLPLAAVSPAAARSEKWRAALDNYWCDIEAGEFWFGDDRVSKPLRSALRRVRLEYRYRIGRYLVTNADYARFIAAGGYDFSQPWWTPEDRKDMPSGGRTVRLLWTESEYTNPTQPIVGITWYEAAAYAAWLTVQGHEQGWLPRTHEIRLPTSLEWERAARHTDKRRYPWSDDRLTPEHANYGKAGIGLPSPVGCFPLGQAAGGMADMAGNVFEWLATPYEKDGQIQRQKDFTPREGVLLAGGAFGAAVEYLCCGARSGGSAGGGDRGMRLVWSPRSSV